MTLFFPSRTDTAETFSLANCRTHVATCVDNHLMVFKKVDDAFFFDFAFELPEKVAPDLVFNDLDFHETLYLAAFSTFSITIIEVLKKRIVATFATNCSILMWDLIQPSSLFTCTDENVIQHSIIEFSSDKSHKANLGIDFTYKFDSKVIKMVIPPLEANILIVLTEDGSIHYFSRTKNYKNIRLIRTFSLESQTKVIDISPMQSNFFLITTEKSVFLYYILKFKMAKVIQVGEKYFIKKVFVLKNDQYKIITVNDALDIDQWKFDSLKNSYESLPDSYKLPSKESKYIKTFCETEDGFAFMTKDYKINFLTVSNDKIFVNNTLQLPVASDNCIASIGSLYAFLNPNRMLKIAEKGNITANISLKSDIIGIVCPTPTCVMYITDKSLHSFTTKPDLVHKVLLNDFYFSKNIGEKYEFTDIKEAGGYVATLIGNNIIYVVNGRNQNMVEKFFFDDILFYDIIDDNNETFFLAVSTKKNVIDIYNRSNSIIASFNVSPNNYLCLVMFKNSTRESGLQNPKLAILERSGYIVFPNEDKKSHMFLTYCTSAVFHSQSNSLAVSTKKEIKVYNLQAGEKPREFHNFYEEKSKILSFDGFTISFWTKSRAIKQYSLGKLSHDSMEIQNKFGWPEISFLDMKNAKLYLTHIADMLVKTIPEPEYVSEIRLFIDEKQHAANLVKGESTKRLFRGLFMSMIGAKLTNEQKRNFAKTADKWKEIPRYINAAVMYHFIGDYKSASECLNNHHYYYVCYYYSMIHNIKEEAIKCASIYALDKVSKGEAVQAAQIFRSINEYHAACHVLYAEQLYGRMTELAKEALMKGELKPSTLGPEIIKTELVSIDDILRISGLDPSKL